MRVLLTTDTIGGVWTFSRELGDQLLARGHSVALVSFGRACSESQRSWVSATASNYGQSFLFHESRAPLEWMQENLAAFADGAKVLLQVAQDFHPDVLHSSQYCWGALPLDVPKLITAHSDVMSWAAACRTEVLRGLAWLSRYCGLVQKGLHGANVVVAPTAWMRDALRSYFEIRSQIEVVPNGRSIPRICGEHERPLQAVSVGRLWDEAKGISALLEMNAPMPVYIAGEEHFETASVSSAAGKLKSLGSLSEWDLFDVFGRSAIYIAASLYEPFGLAPLEAALCGCAVVARDLPSFREVWRDAALYFKTTAELEHVLRSLAEDRTQLKVVQQACHSRASQFTAERMARSYLAIYEDILEPSAQRSRFAPGEYAAHAT
jgi:glycosyltransferase involved in cell wall biosynthesis